MNVETIAVLMTCYNRRKTTLKCLETFYAQELPSSVHCDIYLVDDGCTDGTGESVRERFPEVTVIQGDGNLYWGGGMRLAWSETMKKDYDYYLWLNDDTLLYSRALSSLVRASEQVLERENRAGIIVGSTQGAKNGKVTYGGIVRKGNGRNLNFVPVTPGDVVVPCDTMNGNCVLVPRETAAALGNLSESFTHFLGDFDYGLRALEKGIPIYVCPGYAGLCEKNPLPDYFLPSIPFVNRWRMLHSPKGFPPREWAIFLRRHVGWKWPVFMLKLYLRVTTPHVWKLKESLCNRFTPNESNG